MQATSHPGRGIALMLAAVAVFSAQDGVSRYLAETYNVWFVTMIRYWAMFAIVAVLALRRGPDFRTAVRSHFPKLQILRGLMLSLQNCVIVLCFMAMGLINAHAIFAVNPLLVAALSGPLLGERMGWRRWTAISIGFIGVLIILQPGAGSFSPMALVALGAALMFALYSILTRYVSAQDPASVSLFWVGAVGAVVLTPIGLWNAEPMALADMPLMAALCVSGIFAHWLLIKALGAAESSTVQPFAYAQLVFISFIGVLIFQEELRPSVVIGTCLVIAAGVFTIWRSGKVARR